MFRKILQKGKLDLKLQIMNYIDHYQKEKIKNLIELMKEDLGGRIKTKFVGLRARTYSYLIEVGSED